METLQISTSVLDWAARQAGKTLEDLGNQVVAKKNIDKFFAGKLTVRQIEKVAKITNTPFGYLFLESPPEIERPSIPDLRQIPNPDPLGQEFFEVLEDVRKKQEWYIDFLIEVGADPLEYVGKFNKQSSPETIAKDIANTAKISTATRKEAKTTEEYYRLLADKFEKIGILVFKNSIVKNSSKKGLSVSEFRGFAICDKYAPAVFINGRDAEAAWVFTLAHEVAHIWIGESGVSDLPAPTDFRSDSNIEKFCNKVAAELLTPTEEFVTLWNSSPTPSIDSISRHFKVSRLVIARKALDLRFIERSKYNEIYSQSGNASDKSGGNPFYTIPVRNSKKLTNALVKSAMEGTIMLRDAASLLNVKPDTVVNIYKNNIKDHA